MSKSSQESSPITQWRKTVQEALQGKHWRDPEAAITSATIELIQNAQHDDAKTCSCSLASYLLLDLRQSLKELQDGSN